MTDWEDRLDSLLRERQTRYGAAAPANCGTCGKECAFAVSIPAWQRECGFCERARMLGNPVDAPPERAQT